MSTRTTDQIAVLSGTITRPADTTPYASGDLVANNVTAGSVTAIALSGATINPGGKGRVERVRLSKTNVVVTNASFRVHLFTVSPVTFANGDNGAFSSDGVAGYLGYCDVTVGQAFTDGSQGVGVPSSGSGIAYEAMTGTSGLYVVLEARGAYTPTSAEIFTVKAEVSRY